MLAGAFIIGYLVYENTNQQPEPSLEIDYTKMEPQVAEKLRKLQHESKNNPGSAEAWGKLGMTLDVHGFNEQAILCYQKAADYDPNSFRWQYFWAIALKEHGAPEALERFEAASKLNPAYVPFHIRYARALFDAGRLEQSKSAFRTAIGLDPKSAEAYTGLAQIAMQQKQDQAALQFAKEAVAMNPDYTEAYKLMEILYRRLNDADKVSEMLSKTKALPGTSGFVDPIYATLVAEGESAFWYRTRGRTYLDSGLYVLAVREFKKALELQPDADAYDNMGTALQRIGKPDEALFYHRKAAEMNPDHLKFYNLGIAYGKLNRLPDAINAFKRSLQLKSDQPEAHYNLGVAYFKLEQWNEAAVSLNTAIAADSGHANAHFALAMVHLARGERNQAERIHQKLQQLKPALALELSKQANF